MISPSSTLSHGHHRRQISTPAPFEAAQPRPMATSIPPRRAHRRGQTVDYGSFGPHAAAVDRRNATSKVTRLRDFFNEKSGFSQQGMTAQQFAPAMQDQQSFIPSDLPAHPQYQSNVMWSREDLEGMYGQVGNAAAFPTPIAPALMRSASDNPDPNAAMKNNIHRMRQDQEQRPRFGQPISMISKEQAAAFAQSMQPVSVQPEAISPKINPYLSCKLTQLEYLSKSQANLPPKTLLP